MKLSGKEGVLLLLVAVYSNWHQLYSLLTRSLKHIMSPKKMNTTVDPEGLDAAWHKINQNFPFEGYVKEGRKSGYQDMVKKIAKWSGTDVSVLDFGAGPCDKTAMFSLSGMRVTAFDTLEDAWHKLEGNKEKILDFSKQMGIEYCLPTAENPLPFLENQYDVLMSHDVVEHLHSSPRVLLNKLLQCVKPGGILAITVPNAANLRKRIHLMMGKTNYNKFDYFYWYPGMWNGHVREYVYNDLFQLNEYLGLELLELSAYSLQLDVLPKYARKPFHLLTTLAPGVRDSWMLISRKPEDWQPLFAPNVTQFQSAFGSQYFDYTGVDFDWES